MKRSKWQQSVFLFFFPKLQTSYAFHFCIIIMMVELIQGRHKTTVKYLINLRQTNSYSACNYVKGLFFSVTEIRWTHKWPSLKRLTLLYLLGCLQNFFLSFHLAEIWQIIQLSIPCFVNFAGNYNVAVFYKNLNEISQNILLVVQKGDFDFDRMNNCQYLSLLKTDRVSKLPKYI